MIPFIILFAVDILMYLTSVIVGSVFLHSGCLSDAVHSLAILMVVIGSIVTLLSLVSIIEIVRFVKKQNRYRGDVSDNCAIAFIIALWIFTTLLDLVYSLILSNGFTTGFDTECNQVVTGFTIARLSLIGFNLLSWLTVFLVRRIVDTAKL